MPPTGELRFFLIYTRDEIHHQQVPSSITRWLQGGLFLNLTFTPELQEKVSSSVKPHLYVVVYLGTGWSLLKVFSRRIKKIGSLFHKVLSTGARLWTQPRIRGRHAEFCSWAGGGHRKKLCHFFGLCNRFPKHSHTTLVFQCSLSRKTSHAAVLRAQCLNKLIFSLFIPQLSQTSLPLLFLHCLHRVPSWSGSGQAQVGGHPLAEAVVCSHACSHAQPQQLSDCQEICKPEDCRTSAGKALLAHPHALYAAGIKIRFYFPVWVKQSKSSLPW